MTTRVIVIIPAYKVRRQILQVISEIPESVEKIYVIDDKCPEGSGNYVLGENKDLRVEVLFNSTNMGVGGATKRGYQAAIARGITEDTLLVKVDGDGQIKPSLIEPMIEALSKKSADYAKGNRFLNLNTILNMPKIRIVGNAVLTLFARISSGYWDISDPNNGFTAIKGSALLDLNLSAIDNRFFFESDMLFRLNCQGAKVLDFPMDAVYANEKSNLKVRHVALEFFWKHIRNSTKRYIYTYFLKGMSPATFTLPLSIFFLSTGFFVGIRAWFHSFLTDEPSNSGTVVLVAILLISGLQMLLSFIQEDVSKNVGR